MEDFNDFGWQLERVIHKYTQFEKKPQLYLNEIQLAQPEIHTITIVGDQEGINITELAGKRAVTKGAVSQMIYKLADKGLVEKRPSPQSNSEINLYLTSKGKRVYDEHQTRFESMRKYFEDTMNMIPNETRKQLMTFLERFESELDKLLKGGVWSVCAAVC